MSDLPVIPAPATPLPQQAPEGDVVEQLKAVKAAWERAQDAIMEAWKLTPGYLTQTRLPVPRDRKTQTIAFEAAQYMASACDAARTSVGTNAFARQTDTPYALDSDWDAAAQGVENL